MIIISTLPSFLLAGIFSILLSIDYFWSFLFSHYSNYCFFALLLFAAISLLFLLILQLIRRRMQNKISIDRLEAYPENNNNHNGSNNIQKPSSPFASSSNFFPKPPLSNGNNNNSKANNTKVLDLFTEEEEFFIDSFSSPETFSLVFPKRELHHIILQIVLYGLLNGLSVGFLYPTQYGGYVLMFYVYQTIMEIGMFSRCIDYNC